MVKAFRRTYMWRSLLPDDPAVPVLRASGVELFEVLDEHGVYWLEYSSDSVGECETRGELTRDKTVWLNDDGTRNKPILFIEEGDFPPSRTSRCGQPFQGWRQS